MFTTQCSVSDRAESELVSGGSLVSNERTPRDAEPLLQTVPTGLMIAVGSKRVDFNIVMAKNLSHVLAADLGCNSCIQSL